MNITQYREHILAPVLTALDAVDPGQHSIAAEQLMLGTMMVESGGEYLAQLQGPARSLFQVEPATADDVHLNWLAHRPNLRRVVSHMAGDWPRDTAGKLVMHRGYACAIARQVYRRSPLALPPVGDSQAMGAMWKQVYNTHLGAGDPARFASLFTSHVLPLFADDLPSSTKMPLGFGAGAGPIAYQALVARVKAGKGPASAWNLRTKPQDAHLTADLVAMLVEAQEDIARRVRYVADPVGADRWREALTVGDCEDIAIAILLRLLTDGFPAPGALRLGLCKTARGEAHCVLLIFTDRGVFALDNRRPGLRAWGSLGYDWIAVEIPGDNRWQLIVGG